jgi:hypothetical protein
MKRLLLWTFDRGSLQYDVMCGLILVFLFVIPRQQFTDVPAFMKVYEESIHMTEDRNGNAIFTVKLDQPVFIDTNGVREAAKRQLEESLKKPVGIDPRVQPIRDWMGRVVAYAIWKER